MKQYVVYFLANEHRSVIYVGMTGNLRRRMWEHKNKAGNGFTKQYNVDRLVYYEIAETALAAIGREKQIKAGSRQKKIALIQSFNPTWKDLYEEVCGF